MGTQFATVEEIKTRIRAIADLLPQVKFLEPQPPTPPTDAQLWAVIVEDGEANRQKMTLGPAPLYRETREYVIWLFLERLPRNFSPLQEEAAVERAGAHVTVLPAHFALYPRLHLASDGGIVAATSGMKDEGVKVVPLWSTETYTAIRYRLPVITYMQAGV